MVILPFCTSENLESILCSLPKHRLTSKRQWTWEAGVGSQTIRKIFHTEVVKQRNVLGEKAAVSQSAEMFLSQLDSALSNLT